MQYALLIYSSPDAVDRATRPIPEAVAEVLGRPYVTGWARLHAEESATTLRPDGVQTLLTDGPFIDSKEYLAGLIFIEAENLDRALVMAEEVQATTAGASIEVRPVLEEWFRGA